jgi:hypothetical protein
MSSGCRIVGFSTSRTETLNGLSYTTARILVDIISGACVNASGEEPGVSESQTPNHSHLYVRRRSSASMILRDARGSADRPKNVFYRRHEYRAEKKNFVWRCPVFILVAEMFAVHGRNDSRQSFRYLKASQGLGRNPMVKALMILKVLRNREIHNFRNVLEVGVRYLRAEGEWMPR